MSEEDVMISLLGEVMVASAIMIFLNHDFLASLIGLQTIETFLIFSFQNLLRLSYTLQM